MLRYPARSCREGPARDRPRSRASRARRGRAHQGEGVRGLPRIGEKRITVAPFLQASGPQAADTAGRVPRLDRVIGRLQSVGQHHAIEAGNRRVGREWLVAGDAISATLPANGTSDRRRARDSRRSCTVTRVPTSKIAIATAIRASETFHPTRALARREVDRGRRGLREHPSRQKCQGRRGGEEIDGAFTRGEREHAEHDQPPDGRKRSAASARTPRTRRTAHQTSTSVHGRYWVTSSPGDAAWRRARSAGNSALPTKARPVLAHQLELDDLATTDRRRERVPADVDESRERRRDVPTRDRGRAGAPVGRRETPRSPEAGNSAPIGSLASTAALAAAYTSARAPGERSRYQKKNARERGGRAGREDHVDASLDRRAEERDHAEERADREPSRRAAADGTTEREREITRPPMPRPPTASRTTRVREAGRAPPSRRANERAAASTAARRFAAARSTRRGRRSPARPTLARLAMGARWPATGAARPRRCRARAPGGSVP